MPWHGNFYPESWVQRRELEYVSRLLATSSTQRQIVIRPTKLIVHRANIVCIASG